MTSHAVRIVEAAERLIGPESCRVLVPTRLRSRLETVGSLDDLVERIEELQQQRLVVLASGDPLFYGTARFVCSRLGKDRFEVVPHVSSMQLAFARVKESWEDAYLASLSGLSTIERVIDKDSHGRHGRPVHQRAVAAERAVAKALLEQGLQGFQAYVCENLGSPDERVTQGSLMEIAQIPSGR
jgi:precorrin-6Y C5,15-methyltransferase (decarboxylating)